MGYYKDKDASAIADNWVYGVMNERGHMELFPGIDEDGKIVMPAYFCFMRVRQDLVPFAVYRAAWLLWACGSPGIRPRDKMSREARQLLQGSSFSTEGKSDYEVWTAISRFYRHKQEG